jgi:hypothetical protein
VDVWSCGVVVYILLGGYPPFYNDNDAVLFKKIVSGDFEFHAPFWDPVSEAGKDLIRQMLTLNPQERPTAAALLQHPWVTGQAKGQCKASGDLTGAVEQLKRWTAKRRLKVYRWITWLLVSVGGTISNCFAAVAPFPFWKLKDLFFPDIFFVVSRFIFPFSIFPFSERYVVGESGAPVQALQRRVW